jgi:hypothetical protein
VTFLTGTNTELLYVMPAAGAALANSSAQAIISGNTSTNPPYQLLALNNLFGSPSYGFSGRALRVVARGIVATTGTPTLTIVCGLNTTQGTATPAITLAATGAFTTASGIANGVWELEFGIDINSLGITTSSLDALGSFRLGVGNNATTTAAVVYMVGSAAAITTVNPQTAYWVELAAKWGTASASNTITCFQFEIFGLN